MKIILSDNLSKLGFVLVPATEQDREEYYNIKYICCKDSVQKFFGQWQVNEQREYNNKVFSESLTQTYFAKVVLQDKTVGFVGYTIFDDCVGCVTLQITEGDYRREFVEWFLTSLIKISQQLKLPLMTKLFKDSQDVDVYQKLGFQIAKQDNSHYSFIKQ